jgi:alpha-L-fucosidase
MTDSRRIAQWAGVALVLGIGLQTVWGGEPVQISDDPKAQAFALELADRIRALDAPEFAHTNDPGAAWFPHAGFGLFMHWGIHSVAGAQPSWAMIKDYPYGYRKDLYPPEKYWALANRFDPQNYDPEKWVIAAKAAGMTYAVLTTKHHDGYCLWPTKYGKLNTGTYLHGRDLLKPYVDACRKHGLKVGFYFSPRDWSYPGFPQHFDHALRGKPYDLPPPAENERNFERFYAYTVGQLHELLTRYGRIDVLWWDGMGWPGIRDIHTKQTLAWVRSLQPHIVLNNRWGGVGDFQTPECHLPKGAPDGWWETCTIWNGHWGYNPNGRFRGNDWVLHQLATARSWGGNLLLNCGPAPDGTMPPGFYERCAELAQWMKHGRVSLLDANELRQWPGFSPVPITRRDKTWYCHLDPSAKSPLVLKGMPLPAETTLLADGRKLAARLEDGNLLVEIPQQERTKLDDVVVLRWNQEPDLGMAGVAVDRTAPGLVCEVFTGKRFTKLADFAGEKTARTTIAKTISLTPGGQEEQFALRFKGLFQAPVSGEYVFHMTTDDGGSLTINGREIVNVDGLHGPVSRTGRIDLKAGLHELDVLYFQAGGGKELSVEFEGPALPRQSLSPETLWHRAD